MIANALSHSPALTRFVQGWESCRLRAYRDSGDVWTIGWGHTLNVRSGMVCSQAQADTWLENELEEYGLALRTYMTREPSQQQYDALLSISYNCGSRAIGRSGLMRLFNDGDDDACAARFLAWSNDGGRSVLGLVNRRRAELNIYLNADYSGRP